MTASLMDRDGRARMRPSEVVRTVWNHTDAAGRGFLVVTFGFLAVILLDSAWIIALVLQHRLSLDGTLSYVVALTSAVLFQGAWTDPIYTAATIEEYLRLSWWRSGSVPYYRERVRYLATRGRNGRFPGSIGWGILAWGLYLALVGLSVPFVTNFPTGDQVTGFLTYFALTISVSTGFFVASGLRNRRLHREAEAQGYPLASLYPRRQYHATQEDSDSYR